MAAVGTCSTAAARPATPPTCCRRDLRRFLGDHLGVPADAPADVLAAVAAERTGVDEADLRAGPRRRARSPTTQELAALAATIDRIREEVLAHV